MKIPLWLLPRASIISIITNISLPASLYLSQAKQELEI